MPFDFAWHLMKNTMKDIKGLEIEQERKSENLQNPDIDFSLSHLNYDLVEDDNKTLEVGVSHKFEYVLNKLEANFTQYELEEFTQIRSTYAKTAYRLLKQCPKMS